MIRRTLLAAALLLAAIPACNDPGASPPATAGSVLAEEDLAPAPSADVDLDAVALDSANPPADAAPPVVARRCAPPKVRATRPPAFRMASPIIGGAVSNNGCRLAVWNASGELLLFDVEADKLLARIRPGPGAVPAVFVDDARIAFCGDDQHLRLWDGRTAPVAIAELFGSTPTSACRALLVDPETKRLAVVANEGPTPRNRNDLVRKEPGNWGGLSATVSVYDLEGHLLGRRANVGAVLPAFAGGWFTSVHYPSRDPVRSFYDWSDDRAAPTLGWPTGAVFPGLGPGPIAFEREDVAALASFAPGAKPPALPKKRGVPYVGAFSPRGVAALAYASSRSAGAGISLFDAAFTKELAFVADVAGEGILWTHDGETLVVLERETVRFYDADGDALGVVAVGVPPLEF